MIVERFSKREGDGCENRLMFLKLVFRGLSCVIFARSDEWETEFIPKRGKEKNVTKEKIGQTCCRNFQR